MATFLQQLVNGLSLGSIYGLIALGYTMVYGILRLINFAHGDVYMVGAYAGFHLSHALRGDARSFVWAVAAMIYAVVAMYADRFSGASGKLSLRLGGLVAVVALFWLARTSPGLFQVPALWDGTPSYFWAAVVMLGSMTVCAAVGVLIERFAYRPVRKASKLASLITAIGVSLLLENGGQLVFGPDPKFFPTLAPEHELQLGGIHITSGQLVVFVVSPLLMAFLYVLVMKTKTGIAMRAVSFNLDAAKLMGVSTDRIISFTFALGSAFAAAAGVLVGLAIPKIDPLMGVMYGLKAFVAAVLGGIGNIPGALLGGLLIGLAETFVVAYVSPTFRDAIAFAILIAVLLFRPQGILGRVVKEKV